MPILWRYTYKQFFKVFFLTTTSFILILLVTRLKEIARFVALSPEPGYVFAFIFNIIPYILPIAIPIASLLSAIVLFQKLSRSHELTALRCAGYSLFSVIFPIITIALFFSLINFFIVSELTSYSQVFSRKTINKLITTNPLLLLEHRNKLKKKDVFVDMNIVDRGKLAQDVVIVTPNKSKTHLNLMLMESLQVKDGNLYSPHLGIATQFDASSSSDYDHLVIENEHEVHTVASDLTKIMHKTHLHLQPHHLSMPFLFIAIENQKKELLGAQKQNLVEKQKKTKHQIADLQSEIMRRISIGLSVFTFTLIGISFSIEIGRNRKRKNLILMTALTIFGLLCFFTGKMFHKSVLLASFVYLIPHLVSVWLSIWNLSRTMRGIE